MARAALLAVLLCAAPRASADDDFVRLLPDSTVLVVRLELKPLLAAPLVGGEARAVTAALGPLADTLTEFGVHPVHDLTRVVLAAAEEGLGGSRGVVLVAEGTFRPARVRAKLDELAKAKPPKVWKKGDGEQAVYLADLPAANFALPGVPSRVHFAVLDSGRIVFGFGPEAVADAVLRARPTARNRLRKELTDLIAATDLTQALSVIVLPPRDREFPSVFFTTRHVSGGVTLTDGVRVALTLWTRDSGSAKALADDLVGGLDQAKLAVPALAAQQGVEPRQIRVMTDLMSSLKPTARDARVVVTGELPAEYWKNFNVKK